MEVKDIYTVCYKPLLNNRKIMEKSEENEMSYVERMEEENSLESDKLDVLDTSKWNKGFRQVMTCEICDQKFTHKVIT